MNVEVRAAGDFGEIEVFDGDAVAWVAFEADQQIGIALGEGMATSFSLYCFALAKSFSIAFFQLASERGLPGKYLSRLGKFAIMVM